MALVESFNTQQDENNKLAVFPTFHKVEGKMVVVVAAVMKLLPK